MKRVTGFRAHGDGYVLITEPPSEPVPTGDEERDREERAGYFEYQLQVAFEDLCGEIGYAKARRKAIEQMKEHHAMLGRQGRLK